LGKNINDFQPPNLIAPYFRMSFGHMATALTSQHEIVKWLVNYIEEYEIWKHAYRFEQLEYRVSELEKENKQLKEQLIRLDRTVNQIKGRVYHS